MAPPEESPADISSAIMNMKREKTKLKSAFTKCRNRLLQSVDEELKDIDKKTVRELQNELDKRQEAVNECLDKLAELYITAKDTENEEKTTTELEKIEELHEEANLIVHKKLSSEGCKGKEKSDMLKQIKRVEVPKFGGDKRGYESWKAAFTACVDKTHAAPELKLLHLKQSLYGEALRAIDDLGYSPEAYTAALKRLERKFGGERRKVIRYIEELEKFPPIRSEDPKSIERLAYLLDVAVINMTAAGRTDDLGDGTLYLSLQRKLPEKMIAEYQRWIADNEETENVESLREWMNNESKYLTIAAETKHGLDQHDTTKGHERRSSSSNANRTFSTQNRPVGDRKIGVCSMCGDQEHRIWNCGSFAALGINDRWNEAKELRLCFRCLGENHAGRDCRRGRKCGIDGCQKVHHRLLHQGQIGQSKLNPNVPEFEQKQDQTFISTKSNNSVYIALRTVPVLVRANGKELKVNALLDDGSTKTYLNEDVAQELGLGGNVENVKVTTLNGRSETLETMTVNFTMSSIDRQTEIKMEANTTQEVTGKLKPIDWNEHSKRWPHLRGIQFPSIGRRPKVDILIGLDYAELHRSEGEVLGQCGSPTARLTPLGWTCVGPVDHCSDQSDVNLFTFHADTTVGVNQEINETLKRFWEIETMDGTKQQLSIEEQSAMDLMQESMKYDEEKGRYEVPIPWKSNKRCLSNNYEMALNRLKSTERKLDKNPELKKAYGEIIEKYQGKEYVTKVTENDSETKWYLPHFPVVKPDKTTTKVRLVFDASAKYESVSLNDTIYQGPNLQNDLFNVLLRFRKQTVALICDVEEMYLQVGIIPSDRPYHRFLWRQDATSDPDVYQFERVVFGVNASPFLAQYVAQENARKLQSKYPLGCESVLKSTYMDDTMDSVENAQMGIVLYKELKSIWNMAGMNPRKWMSNSPEVLAYVPQTERAFSIDLSKDELPSMKTLGLNWNSESDVFTYQYQAPKEDMQMTKRNVLKTVAALYDPLGFLTPYTIRAKMIMQNMWIAGLDWDEKPSDQLTIEIRKWFQELDNLKQVTVTRSLNVSTDSEIHTFVDASKDAYAAVVYHKKGGTNCQVNMIASKSRVAPLKAQSIPRLELMAAVLGLTLTVAVCSALGIDMSKSTFWSDSMNVLYWIHSQSRKYKTFVANRISTIHEQSSPNQWRYVPTKQNPADQASRGTTVHQLCEDGTWWQGPTFLQNGTESWPENKFEVDDSGKIEMREKGQNVFVTIDSHDVDNRLDPSRYSNWNRLVRISAWVHRFIDNCKVPVNERTLSPELSVQELEHASNRIISTCQAESFAGEYKNLSKGQNISKNSKLMALSPKLDSEGIMRSDSRLRFTQSVSYDSRFPIILPRKSSVTKLLVRHYHEKTNHGDTNLTLAHLSSKYWVMSGREAIRECENSCTKCKLNKVKGSQQIMSTIPDERVDLSTRAFENTAVDYAGPFITKQGRGKTRLKRYLCVFTCMATRAVHLEVAYSLDTSSFMNALNRFTSRRGVPKTVISDNGTNFVGCVRELKELYSKLDRNIIEKHAADQRINWKFIPPSAPHFGGVHEAMVKSAKRAVYAILGTADITDEELITAVTAAEGLINSRPLTYQSSNPKDDIVLTPNHFLHGQMGGNFAPDLNDKQCNIQTRWRRVQELIRHFWKRWLQEYLPQLGKTCQMEQAISRLQDWGRCSDRGHRHSKRTLAACEDNQRLHRTRWTCSCCGSTDSYNYIATTNFAHQPCC